jgi:WD40 repeat protein
MLRQRVETLERQNKELKKSFYKASMLLESEVAASSAAFRFDLDSALTQFASEGIDFEGQPSSPLLSSPGSVSSSEFRVPRVLQENWDFSKKFSLAQELIHSDNGSSKHFGAPVFISRMEFAPSGKTLISAGSDGSLKLWQVDEQLSHSLPLTLNHHSDYIVAICWNKSSSNAFSASADGSLCLWDIDNCQVINSLSASESLHVSCVSPRESSERLVYVGTSDGFIYGYDVRKSLRKPFMKVVNRHPIVSLYSLDSDGLLVADMSGACKLWLPTKSEPEILVDLSRASYQKSGKSLFGDSQIPITHMAVNGNYLSLSSLDNCLRVFEISRSPLSLNLILKVRNDWNSLSDQTSIVARDFVLSRLLAICCC